MCPVFLKTAVFKTKNRKDIGLYLSLFFFPLKPKILPKPTCLCDIKPIISFGEPLKTYVNHNYT